MRSSPTRLRTSARTRRAVLAIALTGMLAIAVAGAQGDSSRVSFASPLAGQTLSGKQKWEVTVGNGPPVEQVQFFVDDQSKPLWTERDAPYVFGGDLGVLDTSSLSNGKHVLAVTLYDKSAKPETFKQEFTVANGVTPTRRRRRPHRRSSSPRRPVDSRCRAR